jgi:hypothetical protein
VTGISGQLISWALLKISAVQFFNFQSFTILQFSVVAQNVVA